MDRELRHQILRALVRDRAFLKQAYGDVRPKDFSDRQEALIVEAAVGFYSKYQEPIGPMLQSEVEDLARNEKFGAEAKSKLRALIAAIGGPKPQDELVSVQALVDRVKALKRHSFYDEALDTILTAHEQESLQQRCWPGLWSGPTKSCPSSR
jgi:hypothetical protein